ncbi:ATP-binding protein [Demequina sp. B12]|uniref:ATP-dependent nuclease n=1 Tax=Demequina sp. B12 TaxID=2992757 RepID=UPI00237B5F17|nr:ATP-binding protein [Demequina sp. B12]MDE0573743.1 ATP-binding protein [Demequina sp. B12]
MTIENFRGVKALDWTLPMDQRLVALIGPGDSGKSTILEAVHWLLGDRWSIPVSDTDFFGVDLSQTIRIQAVLVGLPDALKRDTAFGLWLSGVDSTGALHQDPDDTHTPALIAVLTIDDSLEPHWSVERVDGQSQLLTSAQRRHFSTFKVDDRTDAQLRWSRASALGRMSQRDGADRDALAAASRAAQQAIVDHESSPLSDLAEKVQKRANMIGGGRFSDIKPGLDTSRSSMGAGLALYEGAIPLASFGLGSRRLASLAVQQLASGERSVAVIDELEEGLEPHRAVRLLQYLRDDDAYSQVLVTTHSPVVVEQAKTENLATVQSDSGVVTVTTLSGSTAVLQRLRRSRPSSLLARRVVVAEGKTEHGVLLACLDDWDEARSSVGLSTSAGEGVAIQDAQGGSEVAPKASALHSLGYAVAGFMDADDPSVDVAVQEALDAGVQIVRWEPGNSIEDQACSGLSWKGLSKFIALGVERRAAESTVLDDLNVDHSENRVTSLDAADWQAQGITLEQARDRVATAANKRKWFKEVEDGRALGEWLLGYRTQPALEATIQRLNEIYAFCYPAAPVVPGAAVDSGDTSDEDAQGQEDAADG